MALISCNECGASISNTAASCPSCGHTSGKYLHKSKIAAFALALFLGSFGLHKFYLGNNKTGFLYLIFCWTGVPTILGIIDALIILFKPQKEFTGSVAVNSKQPDSSISFTEKWN